MGLSPSSPLFTSGLNVTPNHDVFFLNRTMCFCCHSGVGSGVFERQQQIEEEDTWRVICKRVSKNLEEIILVFPT